jgi:polyisoprenoid-binding protein YceI
MNKITLVLAALTITLNAGADTAKKPKTSAKGQENATLDVAASSATWTGKKVTGAHTGKVSFKDGEFEYKNGKLAKGEVDIDLTSITDEDLKDAEYNKKLTTHLKSDAFFDVEKFPTAKFKITSLSEIHNITPGQPDLEVKGTLTMRGVTKPIDTKVFFTPTATGFTVKGKLVIDRTLFGLKYNSKKFFDVKTLGDKLIDDNFEVDLNLVAKK